MSGGTDIAVADARLGEITALRGTDAYYAPAIQAEELKLVATRMAPHNVAARMVETMKREIGDWSTLAATFDELPDAVHQAVADELMADPPPWPDPASWEVQQNFRTLPEGKELMREWGDAAPVKLAVFRERYWRILDRLNDVDAAALGGWVDGLETAEAKALMKMLAG